MFNSEIPENHKLPPTKEEKEPKKGKSTYIQSVSNNFLIFSQSAIQNLLFPSFILNLIIIHYEFYSFFIKNKRLNL